MTVSARKAAGSSRNKQPRPPPAGGARQSCAMRGFQTLTDRQFALFQQLLNKETGIWLAPAKKDLLVGRLGKRLRALNLTSFDEYYELVTRGKDPVERVRMVDCICTNETQFFRERRHFEALEQHILPLIEEEADQGRREKRIRVWSAACSTGEEPYSLAMLLLHRYPPGSGWRVEIHASDLSTRVLEKAVSGVFALARASRIPKPLLKRFMLRGTDDAEGLMKAGAEVRRVISFHHTNLTSSAYPVSGKLDLLFCCNVLMYFDECTRERVVDRLADHVAPNGFLFVGHAESLFRTTDRLQSVYPTVYAHASEARECRRSAFRP